MAEPPAPFAGPAGGLGVQVYSYSFFKAAFNLSTAASQSNSGGGGGSGSSRSSGLSFLCDRPRGGRQFKFFPRCMIRTVEYASSTLRRSLQGEPASLTMSQAGYLHCMRPLKVTFRRPFGRSPV